MEDRKVRVILEDLQSKFRAFGESLQDVNRKLDVNTEMIAKNTEDITVLKIDVSLIKDDVSILKKDMTVLKKISLKHTEDMEIIKSDIAFIKTELKKFVRVEEFEVLEKRVILIEKKLMRAGV